MPFTCAVPALYKGGHVIYMRCACQSTLSKGSDRWVDVHVHASTSAFIQDMRSQDIDVFAAHAERTCLAMRSVGREGVAGRSYIGLSTQNADQTSKK